MIKAAVMIRDIRPGDEGLSIDYSLDVIYPAWREHIEVSTEETFLYPNDDTLTVDELWQAIRTDAAAIINDALIAVSQAGLADAIEDNILLPYGHFVFQIRDYFYTASVGAPGTGAGQFDGIRGLVVDPDGTIWATDTNNERIQSVSSALTPLGQYGATGTGLGQFAVNNGPVDADHDNQGHLWVVDRGNHRLQKFALINQGHAYNAPKQLAIDTANGRVYIANSGNNEMMIINSDGTFHNRITSLTEIRAVTLDANGGNIYTGYFNVASILRKYSSALAMLWDAGPGTDAAPAAVAANTTSVFATMRLSHQVRKYLAATGAAGTPAFFGSAGTGDGQFGTSGPLGLCFDGTHVWVVDPSNNRVQKFDAAGVYVTQFPIPVGATGICLDAASTHLFVLCATTGEIRKYLKSDHSLVSTFTLGAGSAAGQISSSAEGIAVAGNGDIWVADTGNNRINIYNSAGVFQTAHTVATTIAAGTFYDQYPHWYPQATYGPTFNGLSLSTISQIAVDSTGRILIADPVNNRLVILTSAGVYSTGITGLTDIWGVCVDPSDNIYTLSQTSTNMRLRKYSSALALQWTEDFGTNGNQRHLTTDGVHVWACSEFDNKVWKRLCSNGNAVSDFGGSGSTNGRFGPGGPWGITHDGTYLYVSDRGNNRVQKFLMSTNAYVTQWPTGTNPLGMAKDAAGNILVANNEGPPAAAIVRYTNVGVQLDSFAVETTNGIGVAAGDVLWAGASAPGPNGTITKWDETVTGSASALRGQFSSPQGVCIRHSNGQLFVLDAGNNRVEVINADGSYSTQWGSTGSGNSQFNAPTAIGFNQTTTNIYVVDAGNYCIKQFNINGGFVRKWGTQGNGNSQFQTPVMIAIHPVSGDVLVTDSTRNDVQIFTANGSFIRSMGIAGSNPGEFQAVRGVAFNADGSTVYFSDDTKEAIMAFPLSSQEQIVPSMVFDNEDFILGTTDGGRALLSLNGDLGASPVMSMDLTISGDTVTLPEIPSHIAIIRLRVDTEGAAATDNLTAVNIGPGVIENGVQLVLSTVSVARDVTVVAGANFEMSTAGNMVLDVNSDRIVFERYNGIWVELSRSNNA